MAVTLNPDKEVVRAVKEGLKRTGDLNHEDSFE